MTILCVGTLGTLNDIFKHPIVVGISFNISKDTVCIKHTPNQYWADHLVLYKLILKSVVTENKLYLFVYNNMPYIMLLKLNLVLLDIFVCSIFNKPIFLIPGKSNYLLNIADGPISTSNSRLFSHSIGVGNLTYPNVARKRENDLRCQALFPAIGARFKCPINITIQLFVNMIMLYAR